MDTNLNKDLASCSFDLVVSEITVFLSILAQNKPINSDTWVTITPEAVAEVIKATKQTGTDTLPDAIASIWNREFTSFDSQTGEKSKQRWFISVKQEGASFKVKLNPEIAPFIYKLTHYYKTPLTNVAGLKNYISYRLFYLIITSIEQEGQTEGTIRLHFPSYIVLLGLERSGYSSFNNFRQKLCVPAMNELLSNDILKHISVRKVSKTEYFEIKWSM